MVLNFCMWFKNGLKAQKLLAQGIALGIMANSKAPCKGKSFIITKYLKLLPLQVGCSKFESKSGIKKGVI